MRKKLGADCFVSRTRVPGWHSVGVKGRRWDSTGLGGDRTGQVHRSDAEGHSMPRESNDFLPLKGIELQDGMTSV